MSQRRWYRNIFVAGISVIMLAGLGATAAYAQQDAAIAGLVSDTTAGVMPGVTIEARSPALIEGVRTAFTDGAGRYTIVNLPPGTYSVTFTLPGFNTILREGVELTSGFTANVNAELQVGSIEETITVTGASPTVDVQRATQQQLVTDDLLAALPSSSMTLSNIGAITPGIAGTINVGGAAGLYSMTSANTMSYHGKMEAKTNVDGMRVNNAVLGSSTGYIASPGTLGEWVLDTGGATAESTAAGVSINYIPKEGSNSFSGIFTGMYSGAAMNSDNLSPALMDGSWYSGTPTAGRALSTRNDVHYVVDSSASVGGPLNRDKLWFYTSHRFAGNKSGLAGIFFNKHQYSPGEVPVLYERDLSRPGFVNEHLNSHAIRITWQASTNNKFNFFTDIQDNCVCRGRGGNSAPEAAWEWGMWPQGVAQFSWTNTLSNRLLLEAGAGATISHWPVFEVPESNEEMISTRNRLTGFRYNAHGTGLGGYGQPKDSDRYIQKFSLSYVTGSHSFKTGIYLEEVVSNTGYRTHQDIQYVFSGDTPFEVEQYATPYIARERILPDLGLYVQDQWTIDRVTLNMGVRVDYLRGIVPAQDVPATRFLAARSYDAITGVPNHWDLNPRLGFSYDLFGTGRTALKTTFGRYVNAVGTFDFTGLVAPNTVNPVIASVNRVRRGWNDANGNYAPDCDLHTFTANGECDQVDDLNFGGPRITTVFDEGMSEGWYKRPYLWDFAAEINHELVDGVSLSVGYYRNWQGNFVVRDNILVGPGDFDEYCAPVPSHSDLPGGGGGQLCGLADLRPDRVGFDTVIKPASDFGDHTLVSNFVNISMEGRLRGSGIVFGGGVDLGRTEEDTCFVVDSPQDLLHCNIVTPWLAQTQFKLHGTIPLPYDFSVSGVFQTTAGATFAANRSYSSAEIASSSTLGRPLSYLRSTRIPLVAEQDLFLPRRVQLDLRFTKGVPLGDRLRLEGSLDIYNVFNANDVIQVNGTFGGAWIRPLRNAYAGGAILTGRLLQVSGRLTF